MDSPAVINTPTHWLLRVGDGTHFKSSSKDKIWGIDSNNKSNTSKFMKEVKKGDILWFVQGKNKGKLLGMATYVGHGKRVLGPILNLSKTNEELGWTKQEGNWDIEIHYQNLYDIEYCELYTEIKSPLVIRTFNEKCHVDLPTEYNNIVRYSKANKIQ